MGDGVACIPTDKARVGTSQLEQTGLAEKTERHSAFVAAAAKVDGFIAVIESRTFYGNAFAAARDWRSHCQSSHIQQYLNWNSSTLRLRPKL